MGGPALPEPTRHDADMLDLDLMLREPWQRFCCARPASADRRRRGGEIWPRVFATTPLRHAHPHFCRKRDEIRAACALPWPSSLTSLKLNKARDADAVGVVAASPVVPRLHALELSEYNITDDGARSLAAADLRSLRELDLGYNAIGPAGVATLASAPS